MERGFVPVREKDKRDSQSNSHLKLQPTSVAMPWDFFP